MTSLEELRLMPNIGGDFELTPSFQPRTKAEALALAQAWGQRLSHMNECFKAGPQVNQFDPAMCAQADAAEVTRLAALWTMLPEQRVIKARKESDHMWFMTSPVITDRLRRSGHPLLTVGEVEEFARDHRLAGLGGLINWFEFLDLWIKR